MELWEAPAGALTFDQFLNGRLEYGATYTFSTVHPGGLTNDWSGRFTHSALDFSSGRRRLYFVILEAPAYLGGTDLEVGFYVYDLCKVVKVA